MDFRSEKAVEELFKSKRLFNFRLNYKERNDCSPLAALNLRFYATQREKAGQGAGAGSALGAGFFLKTRYRLPAELQLCATMGVEAYPRLQFELVRLLDAHRLKLILTKSCRAKAPDGLDLRLRFRLPSAACIRLNWSLASGGGRESFCECVLASRHENLRFLDHVLARFSLEKNLSSGSLKAAARFAFSYNLHERFNYAFDARFEFPRLTPKMRIFLEGPVAAGVFGRLGFLFDPFKALNEYFVYFHHRLGGGADCHLRLRSSSQLEAALSLPLAPEVRLRQTLSVNLADFLRQRGDAAWGVHFEVDL